MFDMQITVGLELSVSRLQLPWRIWLICRSVSLINQLNLTAVKA